MDAPLVSIITPTYNRSAFLPAIAECVRLQTYRNIEWLVLDDSERPSAELSAHGPQALRYFHSPERLSIGEKRNRLVTSAHGDIIVHFDDDDFYGADYVKNAVTNLHARELDAALVTGFFVAHLNVDGFGYYRTLVKEGAGYAFNKDGVRSVDLGELNIPFIHLCYGWTYIYKRDVWKDIRFREVSIFEDREFISAAKSKFRVGGYETRDLHCVHSIHRQSSSQCFPQFLIPAFVLRAWRPEAYRHITRLRQIAAAQVPDARGIRQRQGQPASSQRET
jgi:glycosyltransferase involved in cell wall biosynthesis